MTDPCTLESEFKPRTLPTTVGRPDSRGNPKPVKNQVPYVFGGEFYPVLHYCIEQTCRAVIAGLATIQRLSRAERTADLPAALLVFKPDSAKGWLLCELASQYNKSGLAGDLQLQGPNQTRVIISYLSTAAGQQRFITQPFQQRRRYSTRTGEHR